MLWQPANYIVPTAPAGDSSNRAASTAFVTAAVPNFLLISTHYASGSSQSTTGTIGAGSASLALSAAIDFQNGQGIRIDHAGAAITIGPPTSPSATPTGTGATVYTYQVASLDANGGVSAATSTFTATNNATLGFTAFNTLNWTAGTGSPLAYAVYKKIGAGAVSLVFITTATSYVDGGFAAFQNRPNWLPATPPAAALADWLVTSISSGGGTTSLTLAATATTAVSGGSILHDDTAGLQAAVTYAQSLSAGGTIVIPPNTNHNTTGQISVTVGNIGFAGDAYSSSITSYFNNGDDFFFNGPVSIGIYSNHISGIVFNQYNKINGRAINGTWVNQFYSDNILINAPSAGALFQNCNSVALRNWRIIAFWGFNAWGLALLSDSTNRSDVINLNNVLVSGNSTSGGIGTDKIGILIDGFVNTVSGHSVYAIEAEGANMQISNNVGNGNGSPTFINFTDYEAEFANTHNLIASSVTELHFNSPQIFGARQNSVNMGTATSNVSFTNGTIGGAALDGFSFAGTSTRIVGCHIYANSAASEGGTINTHSGIVVGGSASRFTIIGNTIGDPGSAAFQNFPLTINTGANHFVVTGNIFTDNVSATVNNGAGTDAGRIIANNAT
jgi:hypothetical protein